MRRSWTHEEEGILIDAVATSIRSGRTMSEGMVDAATRIRRTPAACAYHFYNQIDRSDDPRMEAIAEAKRERLWQKIREYPGARR